jgi:hypothetical protein
VQTLKKRKNSVEMRQNDYNCTIGNHRFLPAAGRFYSDRNKPTTASLDNRVSMAFSDAEHRYEMVDGELVDSGKSGIEHGTIAAFLWELWHHTNKE